MEGSLILSSLGRKSKPHPPRNRSYQWRLLCLNQLVPFIVDYAYMIWSTFLYVTNCLYNGSLLNIYFPVLWCSVILPVWLLLIYSKYDKFFFISYLLSLKLDLILFSSLARKTSICWWKVIDLFVLGSAAIYSSCLLVLNWVFLNIFLLCTFREGNKYFAIVFKLIFSPWSLQTNKRKCPEIGNTGSYRFFIVLFVLKNFKLQQHNKKTIWPRLITLVTGTMVVCSEALRRVP